MVRERFANRFQQLFDQVDVIVCSSMASATLHRPRCESCVTAGRVGQGGSGGGAILIVVDMGPPSTNWCDALDSDPLHFVERKFLAGAIVQLGRPGDSWFAMVCACSSVPPFCR